MRPGHEAPEDAERGRLVDVDDVASMRPGHEAPEDAFWLALGDLEIQLQ